MHSLWSETVTLPSFEALNKNCKTDFIKRIVGLPGDLVKFVNGRLYVNGVRVKREMTEDFVIRDANGNAERYRQYTETLPEGFRMAVDEAKEAAKRNVVEKMWLNYYFVFIRYFNA